ncbi:MAG TPA: NAD(P)-dependent oxidoreductase [Acidimicrobiia bacterium]|nr:NAD(P)-dependent oxidoreductase [Acidimicrobiia bacterium]
MPTVAVLGCGRMGGAMAGTLHRAGFTLVVWNRDQEKARRVADPLSVAVASSPAEAVASADIALSSLADDDAVRSVYLGEHGVIEGLRPGVVMLEMSTIDPEVVVEIGFAVDGTGAALLDAPVSGSVTTVEQGALTIMVGGEPTALETARPVLEALSARVIEVGRRGTGAATKLAVNALVHGLNVALSEALVLAERAGVERSVAYEVFASGAGGAPFVQYKREAYEHPESAVVAFSLDLVAKDLELITGLGERVGVQMDQAEIELQIVKRAIAAGLGNRDLSAVAVLLRGDAGTEDRR